MPVRALTQEVCGNSFVLLPPGSKNKCTVDLREQIRVKRIQDQEHIGPAAAQEMVTQRDKAAADYLKRFYDVDWADPMLYDLVINAGKLDVDAVAHLIVNAVGYLPPTESLE